MKLRQTPNLDFFLDETVERASRVMHLLSEEAKDIAERNGTAPQKPAATKPAATKPAATKPATTKSAATKPAATKSAATRPATKKAAPNRATKASG